MKYQKGVLLLAGQV